MSTKTEKGSLTKASTRDDGFTANATSLSKRNQHQFFPKNWEDKNPKIILQSQHCPETKTGKVRRKLGPYLSQQQMWNVLYKIPTNPTVHHKNCAWSSKTKYAVALLQSHLGGRGKTVTASSKPVWSTLLSSKPFQKKKKENHTWSYYSIYPRNANASPHVN